MAEGSEGIPSRESDGREDEANGTARVPTGCDEGRETRGIEGGVPSRLAPFPSPPSSSRLPPGCRLVRSSGGLLSCREGEATDPTNEEVEDEENGKHGGGGGPIVDANG